MQLPSFFAEVVSPKVEGITDNIETLIAGSLFLLSVVCMPCVIAVFAVDGVVGLRDSLAGAIVPLGDCVVDRVCSLCIASLDGAKTIPRLYRHTNRDVGVKK